MIGRKIMDACRILWSKVLLYIFPGVFLPWMTSHSEKIPGTFLVVEALRRKGTGKESRQDYLSQEKSMKEDNLQ